MSYFVAYIADPGQAIAAPTRAACRAALATVAPDPQIAEITAGRLCIAYWAPGCDAAHDEAGGCLKAGDIIAAGAATTAADLASMRAAVAGSSASMVAALRGARGNFALIAWNRDAARVAAATDFVGIYPIFHGRHGAGHVLASAQGLIEAVLGDAARPDEDGVLQQAMLAGPLGPRTSLAGVEVLESATCLLADPAVTTVRYWDWFAEDVEEEPDLERLGDAIHAALLDAVDARFRRGCAAFCQLSGGMDSRLVAFALAERGHAPALLSYGRPDGLDMALAKAIAATLPGAHQATVVEAASVRNAGGNDGVTARLLDDELGQDRPVQAVWAGQGGSVGLGGVYLTAETVAAAAHDCDAAARGLRAGLKIGGLSPRVFRVGAGAAEAEATIAAELRRYTIGRRDQVPYRFLMNNDQRRHQYRFAARAAATRLRYLCPILDAEVVRQVLRAPAAALVGHHLYGRVFARLPAAARSVPWQTYPGHEPCPLPMPTGLVHQLTGAALRLDVETRRRQAATVLLAAWSRRWPDRLIRRAPAVLAALETRFGRSRLDYAVGQVHSVLGGLRCLRR
jgi:hypothetical protein